MKKLVAILFAAVLVIGLGAGNAQAIPINITVDAAGNLLNPPTGIANDAQYTAAAGGGSNDPSTNLAFLTTLVTRWNAVYNPDLPAPGALALDQGVLGGVTSYSGPAGYQYVVFHFGTGQAGTAGPWTQAFYLGGAAISFSGVPLIGTAPVGGFSSARYFGTTSVPDGGATLMLLGGALVGLGALRRKFSA